LSPERGEEYARSDQGDVRLHRQFCAQPDGQGFARHFGRGKVEAVSAGMEPTRLNSFAVAVMREKGVDISGQRSKGFDEALA